MRKYLVKIDDSILPQSFTFDQLIDAGLLDNVDEKIKVKLEGDFSWITARDYPFADVENNEVQTSSTIHRKYNSATRQYAVSSLQLSFNGFTPSQTQHLINNEKCGTINVERGRQETVKTLPVTPSILNTWNWGAFLLSWAWGVCNGIYWPLLIIVCNFIPYIGILIYLGISIFLGIKGNELAWNIARKEKKSPSDFENVQGIWNIVGIILFFGTITIGIFVV